MNLEYLAGFFDGEGSIGIYRYLEPTVQLGLTNEEMLRNLQNQWGGSVTKYKCKTNRKPAWGWSLYSKAQIKPFLEAILPYLILKKQEALVMLEFIESYKGKMRDTHESRKNIQLLEFRRECAKRLKELKK